MSKIKEARKEQLKSQLDHAVVEHIGTEDDTSNYDAGTYSVFVPGAAREHNIITAKDEDEAKAKTLAYLENKIDQLPETDVTGKNVEIKPDNIKISTKTKEDN